jgi:hypothetical protein
MSVLDDIGGLLFGANPTPNVSSTDVTTNSLPSWYQGWINQLLGKASSTANAPYQPYSGPRIAPTSADTTAAYNQTRQNVGAYQPTLQQGIGQTQNAASPFNQSEFDTYMNPYVGGVVDRIGQLAGRNLSENLLPQINDTFTRAGQGIGGSGNTDFTLRALRDTNESALAAQNQALAQGFDTSMTNYNTGRDRQLSAGNQLGSLAQLGQGMGLTDASALQSIGQSQEGKTQQSLDLGYQDFLQQRDYPQNQLNWFSNILHGVPAPTQSTTTSTGPANQGQLAPNPLTSLAGTALGVYGLTRGYKKGGRVMYAIGGPTHSIDPKTMFQRPAMPQQPQQLRMSQRPAQINFGPMSETPRLRGLPNYRQAA